MQSIATALSAPRLTVLLVGLLLGLMHLPLSVELAVSLADQRVVAQTLLMFLYPVALTLTGIGAALAQARLPLAGSAAPIRLAGVAALLFLLIVLRLNFLGTEGATLVFTALIHLLVLGAWFLLLGFTLAGAIAQEEAWGTASVGRVWAIHLFGLVIGYAASDPLVVAVGPNAMLLAAGLSLLLLPRWSVGLMTVFFLVFGMTGMDLKLEQARSIQGWEESKIALGNSSGRWLDRRLSQLLENTKEIEYVGWSRFGQVRVLRSSKDRRLVLYNLKRQYDVSPLEFSSSTLHTEQTSSPRMGAKHSLEKDGRFQLRRILYGLFKPGQRLVFVGVGSGRSMQHLTFEPDKSVTLVERDPGAARFFAEFHPEFNGRLFEKAQLKVADGRHVVETSDALMDAIVLESAVFQTPHSMLPATNPSYIFTQQAIRAYLRKLAPNGVLIFEFAVTQEKGSVRFAAAKHVLASLDAMELPHEIYRTRKRQDMMVVTCPSPGCLEAWKTIMDAKKLDSFTISSDQMERISVPRIRPADIRKGRIPVSQTLVQYEKSKAIKPLGDDAPFVTWQALDDSQRNTLFGMAGALVALGALGMGLLSFQRRGQSNWNAAPYCFLVGVAHAVVTMHAFYAWRTYYGDELLTILRLLIYFLLYGALGSACTSVVSRHLANRVLRMGATLLVLLLHLVAMKLLPFEEPSRWVRELEGALALLPAGFSLGIFLPMGLAHASKSELGRNLCADSLGALVAYALLYLVYLPLGGQVYVGLGILLYLVAAARLPAHT